MKNLPSFWECWQRHNIPGLSAALAFFAILSLAPALAACLWLVTAVAGSDPARKAVLSQAFALAGEDAVRVVSRLLETPLVLDGTSPWAASFGLLTLAYGLIGLVLEIRGSLNRIWKIREPKQSFAASLRAQGKASLLVLASLGLVLVVSSLASFVDMASQLLARTPGVEYLLTRATSLVEWVVSTVLLLLLFTLIHRWGPSHPRNWEDAMTAGLFTLCTFTLGKLVLRPLLASFPVGSAFGQAKWVVALLVWAYFACSTLYGGAAFAYVRAAGLRATGKQRNAFALPTPDKGAEVQSRKVTAATGQQQPQRGL